MYKIVLLPEAEKVYRRLFLSNKSLFGRIDNALTKLAHHPFSGKPLVARLKDKYSLRVGVCRIIYSIEKRKLIVYVLDIGHRGEIYR